MALLLVEPPRFRGLRLGEDLAPVAEDRLEQALLVERATWIAAGRAARVRRPLRAVPLSHARFDQGGEAATAVVKSPLDAAQSLLFRIHGVNQRALSQPQTNAARIPCFASTVKCRSQSESDAFATGACARRACARRASAANFRSAGSNVLSVASPGKSS
ncbi:MAG: hypothetical protein ACREE2_20295 [Stellaceae bacterium]